jgi:hypothetical protein
VIITYEGTDYDFSADRVPIDEWRELKRKYGMSPGKFQEGLAEADPDAMTFLYVAMRRQAGDTRITLGDHVKPDIIALNQAVAAAQEDEPEPDEQEAEPDPTKGSPSLAASPGRGHQKASHSSEGSPPATA